MLVVLSRAMTGDDEMENLILMTQKLWGSSDKALNLEVESSIERFEQSCNSRSLFGCKNPKQKCSQHHYSKILEPPTWHGGD